MTEPLMTLKQAAEYLNVSQGNLRKRIREGKLPCFIKVGDQWRVERQKLLREMGLS